MVSDDGTIPGMAVAGLSPLPADWIPLDPQELDLLTAWAIKAVPGRSMSLMTVRRLLATIATQRRGR